MRKTNTLGMIPNAIWIRTEAGKKHIFTSFTSRNTAYECLISLWKSTSPHAADFDDGEGESEEENYIESGGSILESSLSPMQEGVMLDSLLSHDSWAKSLTMKPNLNHQADMFEEGESEHNTNDQSGQQPTESV